MRRTIGLILCNVLAGTALLAQNAVDLPQQEEKDKAKRAVAKQQEKRAQRASVIEFRGQHAFDEKELRSQLKEQITTIDDFGLTAARGDDLAFFLAVFYRKHGYAKVDVRYVIESSDRLRLEINEGPLMTLGNVIFDGNTREPAEKLFEYAGTNWLQQMHLAAGRFGTSAVFIVAVASHCDDSGVLQTRLLLDTGTYLKPVHTG